MLNFAEIKDDGSGPYLEVNADLYTNEAIYTVVLSAAYPEALGNDNEALNILD